MVVAHLGWAPSERTLQRLFERLELNTRPDGRPPQAFGRFEAAHPNDRWVTDALHGPRVAGRNTYLFAVLDDYSRLLTGYRWGHREDTLRLEAALRTALAAHGIPQALYCDNGSPFASGQLAYACARLGIRIVHSRPGRPQGRGKIERMFGTVRGQFLAEIAPAHGGGRQHRGRHRRSQQQVRRLGPHRLPPAGALRDRAAAPGPVRLGLARRHRTAPAQPRPAAAGVPLDRRPAGHQDSHRVPAGKHLRRRPRPRRAQGRAGLRPGRPDPHRGLLARHPDGHAPPRTTSAATSTPPPHTDTAPPPRPETGIDYLSLLEATHTAEHATGINYLAITDPHHRDTGGDTEHEDRR